MGDAEGNTAGAARLRRHPGIARAEARRIMESMGYGADKRLKVKVSTRDFQEFKDPAVLLVDQLNRIHFDAELEIIESTVWYGRMTRQDYRSASTSRAPASTTRMSR